MINQTSTIATALRARARELDARLSEAYTIKNVFQTPVARHRYTEIYAQCMDAWTTYWRVTARLGVADVW